MGEKINKPNDALVQVPLLLMGPTSSASPRSLLAATFSSLYLVLCVPLQQDSTRRSSFGWLIGILDGRRTASAQHFQHELMKRAI
jgi:hypothetical protein